MSITEAIGVTRKFLREDAGYEKVTVSSAVAIEPHSKWKVKAEIAEIGPDRRESSSTTNSGTWYPASRLEPAAK
jgi:hypothetical protein